jgi:PleD family two-component response regulator
MAINITAYHFPYSVEYGNGPIIRRVTLNEMTSAKILVVDDEEKFRRLFFQTLIKRGYRVRTAANGEDAL